MAKKIPIPKLDGQQILKEFDKAEYDTIEAFRRVEEKLLQDILDNINNPKELDTNNWRVSELKRLEQFRQKNLKQYTPVFNEINKNIEKLMRTKFYQGMDNEQQRLVRSLRHDFDPSAPAPSVDATAAFAVNENKLNALIKATTNDLQKAEFALLRKANDEYRKIIYDAEVGLNTGSLTYREAAEMATKDLRERGFQCVEYKNGAKHTLADYSDMAVKTANKKAYLYGEGEKREEYGLHLVVVSQRSSVPCKCCAPYIGKVLIDDVYSGGSKADGNYPLLSDAMKNGLFHPRCKDIATTYIPGVTKLKKKTFTQEQIEKKEKETQRKSYINRNITKYERMAETATEPDKKAKYKELAKKWRNTK